MMDTRQVTWLATCLRCCWSLPCSGISLHRGSCEWLPRSKHVAPSTPSISRGKILQGRWLSSGSFGLWQFATSPVDPLRSAFGCKPNPFDMLMKVAARVPRQCPHLLRQDDAGSAHFGRVVLQLGQAVLHWQYGLRIVDVNARAEFHARVGGCVNV